MRILYLTWGEVPRMSSVYGGQAVEVVAALQRHSSIEYAGLLAGYPIIHSGLVREKWKYRNQLTAIKNRLGADCFLTRRIPVPPVGVHPKPWQLPFFTAGQHRYLAKQIRKCRANIVQCRSYVATHFALQTRDRHNMDFKIVFDARSLMPEEAVVTKGWKVDGPEFAFWKAREAEILAKCELSIGVSQPMQNRFDALGAAKTALIHLNVDLQEIDHGRIGALTRVQANEPVLAYCGYLAENTWHSPTNLWQVFASFRKHCAGAKLLVITKSDHSMLRAHIAANGMADLLDAITFTSAASPRETVGLLNDADLSVLSYRNPQNAFEKDLAESVFATKSAEYLSVGLPMIVNQYCGGARDYVRAQNAGVAYDPETGLSSQDVDQLLNLVTNAQRISKTAQASFGLDHNVDRLAQLYQNLLDSPNEGRRKCA